MVMGKDSEGLGLQEQRRRAAARPARAADEKRLREPLLCALCRVSRSGRMAASPAASVSPASRGPLARTPWARAPQRRQHCAAAALQTQTSTSEGELGKAADDRAQSYHRSPLRRPAPPPPGAPPAVVAAQPPGNTLLLGLQARLPRSGRPMSLGRRWRAGWRMPAALCTRRCACR